MLALGALVAVALCSTADWVAARQPLTATQGFLLDTLIRQQAAGRSPSAAQLRRELLDSFGVARISQLRRSDFEAALLRLNHPI